MILDQILEIETKQKEKQIKRKEKENIKEIEKTKREIE